MSLIRLLKPCEAVATVFDIDYERLRASGKRAVLFDLDNTLERGRPTALRSDTKAYLHELVKNGLRVGILSNRRYLSAEQKERLCVEGIPMTFHAGKPRRRAFRHLMNVMGVRPQETVFIGDRRLTDIAGANRAGLYSILVRRPAFLPEPQP